MPPEDINDLNSLLQESYPELIKVKFNYEYLRKSIETKTKEIE